METVLQEPSATQTGNTSIWNKICKVVSFIASNLLIGLLMYCVFGLGRVWDFEIWSWVYIAFFFIRCVLLLTTVLYHARHKPEPAFFSSVSFPLHLLGCFLFHHGMVLTKPSMCFNSLAVSLLIVEGTISVAIVLLAAALYLFQSTPSHVIDSLPAFKFCEKEAFSCNACGSCHHLFKPEETVTVLKCGHAYHSDCIKPLLRFTRTCRTCSESVLEGDSTVQSIV